MNYSLSIQLSRRFRLYKGKLAAKNWSLTLQLASLFVVPYLLVLILPMDSKGTYVATLGFFNIIMMLAMLVQFPLGARLKRVRLFSQIDWNIKQHKKIGQWIGLFFFLHPMLIMLPKVLLSGTDFTHAVFSSLTEPRLLTGVIAWVAMVVWVLMSIFKHKIAMRYEHWRLVHIMGFIAILVLATAHITEIGSHGQFQSNINVMWWALCASSIVFTIYGYFIKPFLLSEKPFSLVSRDKISDSDWLVTVKAPEDSEFNFDAGQFVWLGSKKSALDHDYHPFSMVSTPAELPNVSFLVRELGDYTSSLAQLKIGQPIFIDGPYGGMTLGSSESASSIVLIASGVGLGPIMSLLRQLHRTNETRPVRLVYGNQRLEQMVFIDEIKKMEKSMTNFKAQLVCYDPTEVEGIYSGYMNSSCLKETYQALSTSTTCTYLCGSPLMVEGVQKSLEELEVPPRNVHFEQLSF
jgi:predicted ferric reductase